MSEKEIVIEPITRIEGTAKVTIKLDENDNVTDAMFSAFDFRGFEKFLEGRPIDEAPRITPRVCGICPVSHHLASSKAADNLLGVDPPKTGKLLRELMHMGQYIHSHALHFFYLAAPDFVMGPDSDPAVRNIVGVIGAAPTVAKRAIELRAIGQKIIEIIGGKAIHPDSSLPGGVSQGLSYENIKKMKNDIVRAKELALWGMDVGKNAFAKYEDLINDVGNVPTYHMGMVKDGVHELYDGPVRICDSDGKNVAEYGPDNFLDHVAEHIEPWTYAKLPYYKKAGWPDGIYRVNSLSRLNVADKMATEKAQEFFEEYKNQWGNPVHQSLLFHYARLIELVYAAERAEEILNDSDISSQETRVPVQYKEGEGVGIIEAPRGTLIHHFKTNEKGRITYANLIVGTTNNNAAINLIVKDVAKKYLNTSSPDEALLNKVEIAIRSFDPCLTCATHNIGERMPLEIQFVRDNEIVRTLRR